MDEPVARRKMTEEVARPEEERAEEQEVGLGQGEEEEDEYKDLKPWEQHFSVISIPRYDYKATSSLLERSHSGFLITTPLKREKSATKEAILILEEHIGFPYTNDFERSDPFSKSATAKRRKTCLPDADNADSSEWNTDGNKSADSSEAANVANLLSSVDGNVKRISNLSLVKLTKSGLVLFTLPNGNYHRVIDTFRSIFYSLASGNQKPPIWCHRIFPIQEICCLTETDLQEVVTKLVLWNWSSRQDKVQSSIKFAVGYNRRGIEGTEMKDRKCNMLERNKCFEVVARAFKTVVENSVVDLKNPEVAMLVELLPLSGLPQESLMVGVSVLPRELIMTKPRLSIKPLVYAEGTKVKG